MHYEKPELDRQNSSILFLANPQSAGIHCPRSLQTPSGSKTEGHVGHKRATIIKSDKV